MKIKFNGFEIEVKAKEENEPTNRFNKKDTLYLLNQISIWAHEASENYKNLGLNSLAESAEESANDIYNVLKSIGFYD